MTDFSELIRGSLILCMGLNMKWLNKLKKLKKKKLKSNVIRQNSTLGRLLSAHEICVLDVGARPKPKKPHLYEMLAPVAKLLVCDPDKEITNDMETFYRSREWRSVKVYDCALGEMRDTKNLFITNQPGLSSLLEPNMDVITHYYSDNKDRYKNLNYWRVAREDTCDVNAIDSIINESIHIIKLDTQGSELDILKGGVKALQENVSALIVEVSFQQFYSKQALFSDIDLFLRKLGYVLIDIELVHKPRISNSVNWGTPRREIVWGDAIYIKDPDVFARENLSDKDIERLVALLGFSVVYSLFGIVDMALDRLVDTGRINVNEQRAIKDEIEALS